MDATSFASQVSKHADLGVQLADILNQIADKLKSETSSLTPDDFSLYRKLIDRKYDKNSAIFRR